MPSEKEWEGAQVVLAANGYIVTQCFDVMGGRVIQQYVFNSWSSTSEFIAYKLRADSQATKQT